MKQPETVEAMCVTDFQEEEESEAMSKRDVLQIIKETFAEMRCARAEREEAASLSTT